MMSRFYDVTALQFQGWLSLEGTKTAWLGLGGNDCTFRARSKYLVHVDYLC